MASWNGVCFWVYPGLSPPIDLEMASNSSGSFGFGAVFRTHWLYGKWPSALQSASIKYKELFPNVVAAHVWGLSWFKQVVLFHCDNESVVFILNSRTSRAPDVMHLLRLLLMAAAHHNFIFSAQHIAGSANKIRCHILCPLAGLSPPGTTGRPSAYRYPSSSLGNINISSLEKDCLALMSQDM